LTKIERRIRDEKQARVLAKQQAEQGDVTGATAVQLRDDLEPNAMLEVGRTLPAKLGDFPPELYGKPIEELDEYYFNKYVSIKWGRVMSIRP
jgi:voltage-gated sodium channel type IV alpha